MAVKPSLAAGFLICRRKRGIMGETKFQKVLWATFVIGLLLYSALSWFGGLEVFGMSSGELISNVMLWGLLIAAIFGICVCLPIWIITSIMAYIRRRNR